MMEILKMFCYAVWGVAGIVYTLWMILGYINGRKLLKEMYSDEDEA